MASLYINLLALSLLLLASSPAVSGNLIFVDYTDGFEYSLQPGFSSLFDHTYLTGGGPGSISFGVFWNSDPSDYFSLSASTVLNVTVLNGPVQCSAVSVQLNASVSSCSYTAAWTQPVTTLLSIAYNNGNSQSPSAANIAIAFSSAAPPTSSSSSASAFTTSSSSFLTSSSHKTRQHISSSSSSPPSLTSSSSSERKKKKKDSFVTSSSSNARFLTSSSSSKKRK